MVPVTISLCFPFPFAIRQRLKRNNNLLSRHALFLKVVPGLDTFEPLPHNVRFRSGNERTVRQRLWEIIHIHGLADFVVEQRRAGDESRAYAPRFGLDPDIRHAADVRRRHGEKDKLLGRRLRDGI